MTATCETCRWWERHANIPRAGGCRNPINIAPVRGEFSLDADVVLLRFAPMTCGEHQPKEPTP